jgi:hypothetical protein
VNVVHPALGLFQDIVEQCVSYTRDYGIKASIVLLVYDLHKKPSVSSPIGNQSFPSEYIALDLHTGMANHRSPVSPPVSM